MTRSNGDDLERLYKDEAEYVLHMRSLPTEELPIHTMLRAKQRLADRHALLDRLKTKNRTLYDTMGAPIKAIPLSIIEQEEK